MAKQRKKMSNTKAKKLQRKIQKVTNRLVIESKSLEALKLQLQKDRLNNIKAFGVRNIKVVGAVSRFIIPYVLAGSLTVGIGCVVGLGLPLVEDIKTYSKDYFLEYETGVKSDYEESYTTKKDYINFLSITTPWTLTDSGVYEKYIREYVVNSDNIESLFEALLNDDIEYILENIEVKKETREERTFLETTETDYYVNATLQGENKEITMDLVESPTGNFWVTILELAVVAVLSYGWTQISEFKVGDRIKIICGDYKKTIVVTEDLRNRIKMQKRTVLALRKELKQYGR